MSPFSWLGPLATTSAHPATHACPVNKRWSDANPLNLNQHLNTFICPPNPSRLSLFLLRSPGFSSPNPSYWSSPPPLVPRHGPIRSHPPHCGHHRPLLLLLHAAASSMSPGLSHPSPPLLLRAAVAWSPQGPTVLPSYFASLPPRHGRNPTHRRSCGGRQCRDDMGAGCRNLATLTHGWSVGNANGWGPGAWLVMPAQLTRHENGTVGLYEWTFSIRFP